MAEVRDYYPGDVARALDGAMAWMLSRLNVNVSPFHGNAVSTLTDPAFAEGAINRTQGTYADLAQETWPNIVLDPVAGVALDTQAGPDGFPINYSATPLLSGNLLVNLLPLTAASDVSGRVLSLLQSAGAYRVDVYTRTDAFYYQGSSSIAADSTWRVASVSAGSVIAFLMPSASPQPSPGSWTSDVTGWVAHSNLGVGKKLRDYFVRLFTKTDIEYLKEDDIPILVQDSTHARFGSSRVLGSGTPVAHVIYNDPQLGELDLYSTLQSLAAYSDLPRSIEVPPSDPDYVDPSEMTRSKGGAIQNRCWIYDAALAIITLAAAGLWEAAGRIVARLNALREDRTYLPNTVLENCEDGSIARWTKAGDPGAYLETFNDPLREPYGAGKQMHFHAAAAGDNFTYIGPAVYGDGLPDATDPIIDWQFRAHPSMTWAFEVTLTTQQNAVTKLKVTSDEEGPPTYDSPSKTITYPLGPGNDDYRFYHFDLAALCQDLASDTWASTTGFKVILMQAGELYFDNLSCGDLQPEGSLSFSYDVYNGQVDKAYVRNGAMAWVCYAYAIHMEQTGDFARAALALESMLQYLFTQQSTDADLRQNLIMLGYGRYADPGYHYVPGQHTSVSTEHNIDCYFAFDKAARVLPTAAQNLYDRGLITGTQYNSLKATATTASTTAGQIRTALLNQLWIPASGGVKGHFAQGASSSGLDTALALDAAGSWAAMFCHEVGEDAKAVECLEFIYETFFLTNQQILKSSEPSTYNQAYEQLTPFDGFKPYADSAGGYSGSPSSVWMEGTWGAVAAYLRLSAHTDLEAYFAANYPGGLNAFLSRLIQSMKIVGTTTADRGVLSFSLAARGLPWELAARKTFASTSWFWVTATRNDLLFTTTTEPLRGRPLLKIPQGVQQSIRQLEGQGSIGALELEAIDGAGFMTALASGGKLEGRKVTLKVGYPGMASSDFVTLATQEVEAVETLPDLTGYVLQCRDLKRSAKSKIFTRGDDGFPISRDHPRTLLANPMDVLLMVCQNELGLGQVPSLPESSWKLYDPAQWDSSFTTNPTLIRPNPYLDVEQVLAYRHGIFSGYLFEFTFTQPVEAKQFLEYEIFRALGGYWLVLADGRWSPRFFVPPYSFAGLFAFNERNITVLPGIERHPIINQVTYRMDYDGSNFQTELLFLDAPSLQQFGLAGQHIIESKGMRLARQGGSLAALTAIRIFRRYGGLHPVDGAPTGGAATLTVTSHFMTLGVEVGDYVFVSHPLLPNFASGRRGVFNRIFEVVEKQPNYSEGTMTHRLLDVGWMKDKQLSRLAPQGTPPYPAASSAEQARYMFLCDAATNAYSDGTAGKTIW